MSENQNEGEPAPPLDNLFRHEAGKLVAALTRVFGPQHLALAEDVAQDALLKALEQWKFHGVPKNPSAWLFTVARNKALDVLRQKRHEKEFAAATAALLKSEYTAGPVLTAQLSPAHIEDEQLRMMFVCCHPALPTEAQVALTLKTLCGFSVAEIAHAFITQEETITKRLYRARETLRTENVLFELPPPAHLTTRLDSVLLVIYLIFTEGYHASHHPTLVREDLVEEALRLANMLTQHSTLQQPAVYALLALMCLNTARLPARLSASGHVVPLKEQDRTRWNQALLQKGRTLLEHASAGEQLTAYHLEAAIAYEHTAAKHYADTQWPRIVQLYDWLLALKPAPLIQLNRLIALAEWKGAAFALTLPEIKTLEKPLATNALFHATLANWHQQANQIAQAKTGFEKAILHSTSTAEQQYFNSRLAALTAPE